MSKKIVVSVLLVLFTVALAFAGGAAQQASDDSGLITVGIINNPPSESGYRTANDRDMKDVFTGAGYAASFAYSIQFEEQLVAFNQFVTQGVDYILLSAAATDGWDDALEAA
ncbi:MAG: sugar ABC transporter substrate-binding protein, partial [Treponema sp.]|nr:sugar ABC transporter substrate-binding protein [Treponema sp.]